MSYLRKSLILVSMLLAAMPAVARQRVQGWCQQGNRVITVGSTSSSTTTPVQRSFPSCVVTVYLPNTITKPQLYADNSGTTKTNPFTAATTGYWFFYVDDGSYDVQFSGAGISPTYTFGALSAMDPFFYAPSTNPARLISQKIGDVFSVKDYGALGDGSTNDLTALQAAVNGACSLSYAPKVYFPRGKYNIAGNLALGCNLYLFGDGAGASIVWETTQTSLTRAITTDYSLTMVDMEVSTTPLVNTNLGMVAVARGFNATPTSVGQVFQFIRFRTTGFNFGLIISGKNNTDDIFDSLLVQDSYIRTYTAANAVSNPINAANGKHMWVSDSTLQGDTHGDHAIYTITIRDMRVFNNVMDSFQSSAVKMLTASYGVGATCPVTTNDYQQWTVESNLITNSWQSVGAYTYCSVVMPSINLVNNTIRSNPSTYSPDFADMFIQANCQSIIKHVNSMGNTWENIGIGAIVLVSSVQSPSDGCADSMASGTINEFTSTNDSATNFSSSFSMTFPVINTAGPNLLRATVVNLHSDGGGGPLNLGGFAESHVYGMIVGNAPVSNVYALNDIVNPEPGRSFIRHKEAPMQTADVYQLLDSNGALMANITADAGLNFNTTPGLFAANGTRAQGGHIVFGPFTLSSGAVTITLSGRAVFTSSSTYRCTANLSSTAVALLVSNSNATSFAIQDGTGSSSSTGNFICAGN